MKRWLQALFVLFIVLGVKRPSDLFGGCPWIHTFLKHEPKTFLDPINGGNFPHVYQQWTLFAIKMIDHQPVINRDT